MKKTVRPDSLEALLEMVKKAKSEGAEVEFVNADTGESGIPPELAAMLGDELEGLRLGNSFRGKALEGPELIHSLLDIVQVHAKPPVFEAGTFVRHREDVQYVKDARDLHVVVERLKEPRQIPITDDNDGNCTTYRRYDCIIAKGCPKGIVRYLADSRELEVYPAEELAKMGAAKSS